MPRIKDPNSKIDESAFEKASIQLEEELQANPSPKKEVEKGYYIDKNGKKKKEPNWPLLYIVIAILFFGLGIVFIMLTNLLRGDGFTLIALLSLGL